MRKKYLGLLLFYSLILSVLTLPQEVSAATFTKVEDTITTQSVLYLYPGSVESKTATLFETKPGVDIGIVYDNGISSINTVNICSYTINTSIIEVSHSLKIDNGKICFDASDKIVKSLVGESFTLEYTVRANNGSEANYTAIVFFVEDCFSIHSDSLGLIDEGESLTLKLFSGTQDYIDATWTSSDPSIISVSSVDSRGATAVITGKKQGTAIITAQIKTNSQYETVTSDFTVNWKPREAVLNFDKLTIYVGESASLLLSDLPENASVSFSSSKKKITTVNSKTGLITAKKAGTASISATVKVPATDTTPASSYTLKCKVTVKKVSKLTRVSTLNELKNALSNGKGGNIQLTKHIKNCNSTIYINSGEYRLDLNGYNIEGKGEERSGLIMVNGGTLTLLDSKNKGCMANIGGQEAIGCQKGKLSVYGGTYAAACYSLFIEGGTVKVYGGTFNGMSMAVNIVGGSLTISGGSFNNTENYDDYPDLLYWDALSVGRGAKNVVINGGTFTGCDTVSIVCDSGTVTINHGTFLATIECIDILRGNAVINGGTFNAYGEDGNTLNISPISGIATLTVNGGIFHATKHNIYTQNKAYVFINGGIFTRKDLDWNSAVEILKTLSGTVDIASGVIPSYDINDATPTGQKLIATTFTKNKTSYKEDMTVASPDDAYSAFTDACDYLYPHIEFYCDRDIFNIVYTFAVDDWMEYRHGSTNQTYTYDTEKNLYLVKFDLDYSVNYQLDKISNNPKALANATAEAKKYNSIIDEILSSSIKKNMSAKEKVTAIHDYMCKNYTYDYSFMDASYTVSGILTNNTGVCQAYALLFKSLCRRAGIECYTVEGIAGEPGAVSLHMWNYVVIDGEDLYCDVTFDDGAGTNKWLLKDIDTFYGYGYHY